MDDLGCGRGPMLADQAERILARLPELGDRPTARWSSWRVALRHLPLALPRRAEIFQSLEILVCIWIPLQPVHICASTKIR